MTELQKKEFELLKCFIRICEELELKYCLVCGSALGAVKYGGFIPWDDDIDIALPREDYEIFIREAAGFLPGNYFLQNYKTDKCFPAVYSKMRDSDTAFVERSAERLDINHGIFIDIFPLDGYPNGRIKQTVFELRKKVYASELLSFYDIERKTHTKILHMIFKIFGVTKSSAKIAEKYTKMTSKYKISESEFICNHGNHGGRLEYAPKAQYGKGREACFEGLKVIIPENAESYLAQKYGDWLAEPPKEMQKGSHKCKICDTTVSFEEYAK